MTVVDLVVAPLAISDTTIPLEPIPLVDTVASNFTQPVLGTSSIVAQVPSSPLVTHSSYMARPVSTSLVFSGTLSLSYLWVICKQLIHNIHHPQILIQ
ncbi:hypothetical protein FCV25MIE_15742 [Fagus crenata]